MSEQPKKWKRGDIGPDGRVFWEYRKDCKNGELWKKAESYSLQMRKMRDRKRKKRAKNPDLARAADRQRYAKDPKKFNEKSKRSYLKNREKRTQWMENYYRQNRETRLSYLAEYRLSNTERLEQLRIRRSVKKVFSKIGPQTYNSLLIKIPRQSFLVNLANLIPDPGQTLAELIHKLSGYPMEVCEQIANPPEIVQEPTPENLDNTPPPAILQPAPDLF